MGLKEFYDWLVWYVFALHMLTLKRVAILPDGAFGVLLWDSRPFAVSLERTFDDGKTKIPAIGEFNCFRSRFHRGGYDTFEIAVSGHSRILFHRGNIETDSEGCVLIGEQFGILNGKPAILQSVLGFSEFMKLTQDVDQFQLTVNGS